MARLEQTFRCIACKQDKVVSEYYTTRYKSSIYRRSKCKYCWNLSRRYRKRRMPLVDIRPFLEEIVNRTGSQRKAAAELGIGRTQLRVWIGASPHYRSDGSSYMSRYIHRDSAAHILRTLRRLRSDGTFYDHRGKPGSKPGWLKVNDSEAERKRIARRING